MSRPLSSLQLPPATLAALTRAGYETAQDLSTSTPEALSKDLNIPLSSTQAIFSASQKPKLFPLTQSAASMATSSTKYSTQCPPVDKLLSGGLPRGHIVEIAGPPGTAKETIAVNLVRSFVKADEEVLFVDMQNMTSPAQLSKALDEFPSVPRRPVKLVRHVNVHTLADFIVFMHKLPSYLSAHPRTGLLVLNSISFPFQSSSNITLSARNAVLDRIKQTLTKACASQALSVAITSQLSTKLISSDGSAGSVDDSGSRGIMVPPLPSAYLPPGRTHRLMIVPETRTTGVIRLTSSPAYQPGQGAPPEAPYTMEGGNMK